MALRKGTVIDDTWVLEQPLGAGGMGSVYRAHNRHAPRIKAAIKMFSLDLLEHEEAKCALRAGGRDPLRPRPSPS